MAGYFRDEVAVVTGASKGIGEAVALALAREGAKVTLAARSGESLVRIAREIERLGGEALVCQVDVTDRDQVERMVAATLERWGQIDILIVNAGVYYRAPIADLEVELLEKAMQVNFYAGVFTIKAALPAMLERKKGHIVVVSTMDTKTPLPKDAPYVASKSALAGYAGVLRQELYNTGVDVTLVFPGRVDTPMIEDLDFYWISKKISAERVARSVIAGIRGRKAQVLMPLQVWPLYILAVFAPWISDWFARKLKLEGWKYTRRR